MVEKWLNAIRFHLKRIGGLLHLETHSKRSDFMARSKKERRLLKWHKEGIRKGWWDRNNPLLAKGASKQKRKKK